MALTKYTDMSTEVLPFLAADPSMPLLESSVRAAVIEFCSESRIWRSIPDNQDLVALQSAYDLDLEPHSNVVAVIHVAASGVPLEDKSTDDLDAILPTWQTDTGTAKYFTQIDTEQIILAPMPDTTVTNGLSMILALKPSQDSVAFPKWVRDQYIYDIAAGAIARLMQMPGKAWTDQASGAVYRGRFESAMANARSSAAHGLSRATIRTTSQH